MTITCPERSPASPPETVTVGPDECIFEPRTARNGPAVCGRAGHPTETSPCTTEPWIRHASAPIRPHSCRPLWTAPGHPPIATCRAHFGQPVGVTATASSEAPVKVR